jgi:hypothetical protein
MKYLDYLNYHQTYPKTVCKRIVDGKNSSSEDGPMYAIYHYTMKLEKPENVVSVPLTNVDEIIDQPVMAQEVIPENPTAPATVDPKKYKIRVYSDNLIYIESFTGNGDEYAIIVSEGTCSCPHNKYRHSICKHLDYIVQTKCDGHPDISEVLLCNMKEIYSNPSYAIHPEDDHQTWD